MTIKEISRLELRGHFGDAPIELTTDDPGVVQVLMRFDDPSLGTLRLVETGARAMLTAIAGYDVQTFRQEIDRALGEEGPLGLALLRQADAATPGSFIWRIQDTTKRIDELIGDARRAISEELTRASDRQSEVLGKTVRDWRELDPASGLGTALTRIETMLRELARAVAATQATSAEHERGAAKGLEYEDLVAQVVAEIAAVHGDRAERTGADEGLRRGDKRLAKRGDVTVWLDDQPGIVIEAKNAAKLSAAALQRELEEALTNRGAQAAILVVSSNQNNLMCKQPLVYLRPDMWAVHLSGDTVDPLALQIAYVVARQVALAKSAQCTLADLDVIRDRAEEIIRRLAVLTEIRQHMTNSLASQDKATALLVTFERELRLSVFALLDAVSLGPQPAAA
jgi:hypothetical protein